MSNPGTQHHVSEAKTLIATSDEAKAMGEWDAQQGMRCSPDAYVFADANSIHGSYLRGEYTYAYVSAKGW